MTRHVGAAGLAWLGVAGVALVEGIRLGLGSPRHPGPGFFPALVGLVLAGLAVSVVLEPAGAPPGPAAPGGRRRLLATVGALLGYAALFEPLGFVAATFVVMAFLLGVVEAKPWPQAAGFAAAMALGAWLVFERLLQARLPRGVLARLWP